MTDNVNFTYRADTTSFDRSLENSKGIVGDLAKDLQNLNREIESGGKNRDVSGFLGFASQANKEMLVLKTNALEAELSLKELQELKSAFVSTGGDASTFVADLRKASTLYNDMRNSQSDLMKFLDRNKVLYQDENEQLVKMVEHVGNIFDLVARAKSVGDKVNILSEAGFSRSWLPIAEQGAIGLRKFMQEADRAGAVQTDEMINRAAKIETRWNQMASNWSTYWKSSLLGVVDAINWFGEILHVQDLKQGWQSFQMFMMDVFTAIPGAVGTAATWTADLAFNIIKSMAENVWEIIKYTTAQIKKAFEDALPNTSKSIFGWIEENARASGGWLQTLLDKAKELYDYVANSAPVQAANDVVARTFADLVGVAGAAPKQEQYGPTSEEKGGTTQIRTAGDVEEASKKARQAIMLAQFEFAKTDERAKVSAELFNTTERQKTATLIAAVTTREKADVAAYQKEWNDLQELGELTASGQNKIQGQITQAHQRGTLERMKLADQETVRQSKLWDSVFSKIQGAWDQQLSALLSRTETFGTAMRNIAKTIALEWVKEFEKMALAKAAAALAQAKILGPEGGVGGQIFSSLFGAGQAANMTANTAALTALTAAITGNTVAVASETTATVSETGATIAETIATNFNSLMKAFAIPGFAVGAWEIPSTMGAILHPGEMVVPAGPAAAMREGLGIGGGSGGGGLVFAPQISAIDARGVQGFLSDYVPQIASQVAAHQRKNPSSYR